jgi:hypothetical protein
MRKSPSQPARQSETRDSKSARSRGTAGRKSAPSSKSGKALVVRTPSSDKLKFLKELELIVPSGVPADEREIPLDLTGESSARVGAIHSEFTARLAYVLFLRGQTASHVMELKREIKLARATFLTEAEKSKKYEVDAEAALDPQIRKLEDRLLAQETLAVVLDGVIGGYEKIIEGSSREMSRRSNERTSRGDT